MANQVPMEYNQYLGPDSLRALLNAMKAIYENHTPRFYGHEDIDGSQYEGTVENWGAEILSESRKLLLDKPPLKSILIKNTFEYYFDIKYSNFVNTYDQQNMLCALLKKDVLLSNRTYRLKFENVIPINIPRSKSSSDPVVELDRFVMTTSPPKLVVISGGVATEHTLEVEDDGVHSTVYFFHIDVETEDLYEEIDDGTLITNPIDDSMRGYPMIWMCVNALNTLPDIGFVGNEYDGEPILTIGTNGHDVSMAYPFLSLPNIDVSKCIIKIHASDNDSFIESFDPEIRALNFNVDIKDILLCFYNDTVDIHSAPDAVYSITFDSEHISMNILARDEWLFRTPVRGDYDYDGTTYINRVYAYINANVFEDNISNNGMIPMLKINMSESYLYEKEYLTLNTYSGMHIDVTSEHSDNGVIKKNGVIHSFGDYDGLPTYFKYDPERNRLLHRAHVELYATRDKKNDNGQHAYDKPTAGLIIDSGIPQTEIPNLDNTLPVTIRFDNEDTVNRHFKWYDPPISEYNVLSEIVYIDPYHFGNARIGSQSNKKKFIYHGNRHFSLSGMGFDPDLEYGRVYIISNDNSSYENNDKSANPKPASTFARICDIPTSYAQLTSIPNYAPTFIFDINYVRTEVNYTEEDVYGIYNKINEDHVISMPGRMIFDSYTESLLPNLARTQFSEWENLMSVINLNDNTVVEYVMESGESIGYQDGDIFEFHIGGIDIKGKVISVNDGVVEAIRYYNSNTDDYDSNVPVLKYPYTNIYNLSGDTTVFDTSSKTGSGSGLKITVNILNYENYLPYTEGLLPDTIYFFKDSLGNISIYKLTNDYDNVFVDQVTGAKEYLNLYDNHDTYGVDVASSMLYLNTRTLTRNEDDIDRLSISAVRSNTIKNSDDIHGGYDWSEKINEDIVAYQDSYYILQDITHIPSDDASLIRFTKCDVTNHDSDFILPQFSDLNLKGYYPKSNIIRCDDDVQPSLFIYDPNADTKYTTSRKSKDLLYMVSSHQITYKDIFIDNEFMDSPIDNYGYLTANIYKYDEYDTSKHTSRRAALKTKTRAELISMIYDINPYAEPLRYENDRSLYKYSENMLIDYIMENTLYWETNHVSYTSGPPTFYRKPEISALEFKGTQIFDSHNRPLVDQPKGDMINVSSIMFDPRRNIGSNSVTADRSFVFKLDGDILPASLDGFRMRDEYGNDVSTQSILIIGTDVYVANIESENISWVKIQKRSGD